MKKNVFTVFVCTLMFCALVLSAVLTGCDNLSGAKPKPKPNAGINGFIPDGIEDSGLSKLPSDFQTEIQSLYGCYWISGAKDNCAKITDDELIIYSTAMSFNYTNIRWAKLSSAEWVCCAYHAGEENYSEEDRKVILKFTKDAGMVKVWQYVVPMKLKSGPFTKGKEVESIVKDGKTFYVYDKTDPDSPEMGEPKKL